MGHGPGCPAVSRGPAIGEAPSAGVAALVRFPSSLAGEDRGGGSPRRAGVRPAPSDWAIPGQVATMRLVQGEESDAQLRGGTEMTRVQDLRPEPVVHRLSLDGAAKSA